MTPETSADGAGSPYAGLATRTLAFAADAVIVDAVALFVGLVVGVGLSLIGVPETVGKVLAVIGAVLAVCWIGTYFVFFWSTTGQTPGSRALGIRVVHAQTGQPVGVWRAVVRLVTLPLSAVLLCAGFLLILVEPRRRALHDRLAGTVVPYAISDSAARSRRVVGAAHPDAEQQLRDAQREQERAVHGGNDADADVRPDQQRDAGDHRERAAQERSATAGSG